MFKRELKVNFKSFLIWAMVTVILYLVIFLVYPSVINGPEKANINDMMKLFPEDLLKAFNMDISTIDSAYGWLKSEGFTFLLLIVGCYAGILGSNILLKEESDKTIEYASMLPITRKRMVIEKSVVGVIYVLAITLVISAFNFIFLLFSGEFDKKQYLLLSLTPIFSSLVLFFVCMFLATFTDKTKKMLGLSLGIVLVSYIINTISSMSEKVEFFKYFSPFTLSDIRNVITDAKINPILIILSVVISIALFAATLIRYDSKELV